MDDLLKKLNESGFTPTQNKDEEFPTFRGSYRVEIKGIHPFVNKDTQVTESYSVEYRVTETLAGEKADGRIVFGRHRIAGNKMVRGADGQRTFVPVTPEEAGKALEKLINDVYTCGVTLSRDSMDDLVSSFVKAQGAIGYMKAWPWSPPDAESPIQQFKIVTEKDLGKGAKVRAGEPTIPF